MITTTIVEATATTQNQLVDYVLLLQEPEQSNRIGTTSNHNNNTIVHRPQLQDPYGAVLWPAAQAVTSYILSHFSSSNSSTGALDLLFRPTTPHNHPLPTTENAFVATHNTTTTINTAIATTKTQRTQIIELGCGTGLISLSLLHQAIEFIQNQQPSPSPSPSLDTTSTTAAVYYDTSIIATDYEIVPLQLVQYAATTLNPHHMHDLDVTTSTFASSGVLKTISSNIDNYTTPLMTYNYNHHKVTFQTQLFDICDMSQPIPMTLHDNDDQILIVVADILYDQSTALALAQRIIQIRSARTNTNNIHIIVGDSPGRLGRPIFLNELQRHYDHLNNAGDDHDSSVTTTTTKHHHNMTFMKTTLMMGQTITTPRNELICGPTSTTIGRPDDPKHIDIDILHI